MIDFTLKLGEDLDWFDLSRIEHPFFAQAELRSTDSRSFRNIWGLGKILDRLGCFASYYTGYKKDIVILEALLEALAEGEVFLLLKYPFSCPVTLVTKDDGEEEWQVKKSLTGPDRFHSSLEWFIRSIHKPIPSIIRRKDAYTEISSASPEPIPSKTAWVKLHHTLTFTDDLGQVEPAAGAKYQVTLPNGKVLTGELDANGKAGFEDTGVGSVQVLYEPDIDQQLAETRSQIQKELNSVIAEERRETQQLQETFDEYNRFDQELIEIGAFLYGAGKGIVSLLGSAWDLIVGAVNGLEHAGRYLNPWVAPETFKQDLAELKQTYKELKEFADQDLDIYLALMHDQQTWQILTTFAADYVAAQHHTELLSGVGTVTPAILLALFTSGAGAGAGAAEAGGAGAGSAGAATRLQRLSSKLKPLFKKTYKQLRRKRAKKRVSGKANEIIESDVALKLGGASKSVGAFADDAKLLSHFEKHGAEFGVKTADEYLQVGHNIMQQGTKVNYLYKGETRTGFVQFMGNTSKGNAKFGFVGTNAENKITTIHVESGKSFWKMLNGTPEKIINEVQ